VAASELKPGRLLLPEATVSRCSAAALKPLLPCVARMVPAAALPEPSMPSVRNVRVGAGANYTATAH
jgi:hypothetical protein